MRRYVLASVLWGVVIAACAIGTAVLLGHLVAGIITEPATRTVGHWRTELLILAALWTVRALSQTLQARLGQHGASAVIADLSRQVLQSITERPPSEQAALRADAATLVTSGLDGLRPYFAAYLPALVSAAVLTPAAVVAIAVTDLRSALIVVIALPLIPIFMVLIGLATSERSQAALAAMTGLQSRLIDLIAGIPTLRALGRADGPAGRIAELSAEHRRSAMATLRIAFLSALVLELIATLGVALLAVSVGLRLVFGEMALSAGLTALLLAPDVFWPLRRVGMEFHAAQDGKTAADKAFELIGDGSDVLGGDRLVRAGGARIRLESVSVGGRDGMAPYRVSALIAPGAVTALTGDNGAGKSTTLQAIAALVAPTEGRITVDGVDVGSLDRSQWWRQVAWLAQRPVLVPGTVAENLSLFGPLADPEGACRAAGLDEVLADLSDGMETVIGRGGTGLSLGQRQRIGLARVLGSGAPLLLLDEPTAHLDDATEARVLRTLGERAAAGATVVVVAHRHSVLAIADEVVHLEAGNRVGG